MFIYFWEGERDRIWVREGQREKETQNPKQAPGSDLSAQSLMQGLNSNSEIMTWAKVRHLMYWATQVPHKFLNE